MPYRSRTPSRKPNPPPYSSTSRHPHGSSRSHWRRNVIAAAQAAPSVTTSIYTSAANTGRHATFPGWGPESAVHDYWMTKHEIEELARGAKIERWTIVRPGYFLQNFLPPVGSFLFPELQAAGDDPSSGALLRSAFKPETKVDFMEEGGGEVGAIVAAALSRPEEFAGRKVDLASEALTMGGAGGHDGDVLWEARQGCV